MTLWPQVEELSTPRTHPKAASGDNTSRFREDRCSQENNRLATEGTQSERVDRPPGKRSRLSPVTHYFSQLHVACFSGGAGDVPSPVKVCFRLMGATFVTPIQLVLILQAAARGTA